MFLRRLALPRSPMLASVVATATSGRRWCSGPAADSNEHTAKGMALVNIKDTNLEGVYIMELNSPKANVLTSELINGMLAHVRTLCDPDKGRARGLIITSALPGLFSGGLDINALYHNRDEAEFAYYWNNFQQLFTTLHSLPIPVLAAVNGTAAAAGCIIALACDARVMARQHPTRPGAGLSIGISAARYGLVVPPYVAASLVHVVGFRKAEELLVNGSMLSADEALSVGLVDEVTEHGEETLVPCMIRMEELLAMPSPMPYWFIKDQCRKDLLAPLSTPALRSADVANFFHMLQLPAVRANLGAHVGSLGSKGKNKKN